MQVKIVNGDVEKLASMLNQAMDNAYAAGQQAERERIKAIIQDMPEATSPSFAWVCDKIMEKIDATTE